MNKKTKESPIKVDERSKDEIERWIQMRNMFMTTLTEEITHHKLQMTFCSPESAECAWHAEYLKILYKQKETYGQSR